MRARAVLLLAAVLVAVACVDALTVGVSPHREECFFEEVAEGGRVGVSYQVRDGGQRDIDVAVYGPDERALYNADRSSEGKFTFGASVRGLHRICFSNKMSSVTMKTVSFFLTVGDNLESEFAKQEHLTPLENFVVRLSDSLSAIQSEQRYMRMRERVHRDTTESTNERVMWWSFAQVFLIVTVAGLQIYYLKRFFERKVIV